MKKGLILVIAAIMALSLVLSACSGGGEEDKATPVPMGGDSTKAPSSATNSPANNTPQDTEAPKETEAPAVKDEVISVGKPVTVDHVQGSNKAEYLNDGEDMPVDTVERWSAYDNIQSNYTHWAVIDLESTYDITSCEITFEFVALYYVIEVSDTGEDGSWTQVYDSVEDGILGPNVYDSFDLKEAKGRYIRIMTYVPEDLVEDHVAWLASNTGGHPYFSIYEWTVYGMEAEADAEQGGETGDAA